MLNAEILMAKECYAVVSSTRPYAERTLKRSTKRARRPFYVKLTGSWPIFGDSPVDERVGDYAPIDDKSVSEYEFSIGTHLALNIRIKGLRLRVSN